MAILAKGAAVAAALAEEERKNRPGGFFRIADLVIKDGEEYLLRFVTEITDLTTLRVHRFMDTKDKPSQCDWSKWPTKMWAVCQRDNAFRVRDGQGNLTDEFEPGYGDCYLCNTYGGVIEVVQGKFKKDKGRPDAITYGLAVLCKVQTDRASGHVTGSAEETMEFKPAKDVIIDGEVAAKEGEIVNLPKLVLVSQRYENFWHPVTAAAYMSQTITDKVFLVSRKGNDFTVTPVATDPPGAGAAARHAQALAIAGFSLDPWLLEHATPDHYARFFDPARLPEGGYGRKDEDDEEEKGAPATAGPDVDQAALDRFAGRLGSRGSRTAS